jgi:hypothetical protein
MFLLSARLVELARLLPDYLHGELRRSTDPREEANFFTASVLGFFVILRAKGPPKVIKSAARIAIEHLESLRA